MTRNCKPRNSWNFSPSNIYHCKKCFDNRKCFLSFWARHVCTVCLSKGRFPKINSILYKLFSLVKCYLSFAKAHHDAVCLRNSSSNSQRQTACAWANSGKILLFPILGYTFKVSHYYITAHRSPAKTRTGEVSSLVFCSPVVTTYSHLYIICCRFWKHRMRKLFNLTHIP